MQLQPVLQGMTGAAEINLSSLTSYTAESKMATSVSAEPPLSILPDPEDVGQTLVLLDDIIVARVAGDSITLDDIALIPLSAAFDLGLAA